MEDGRSLDEKLGALCDRRALLTGLGFTASLAAVAILGTVGSARAQDAAPKKPEEKKPVAAPRRRGISPPMESAPAPRPGSPADGGESVPGGLPGWGGPKTGPGPGGLPGNR
jgi:hypothetical protein